MLIGAYKFQIPNSKFQIPNSKFAGSPRQVSGCFHRDLKLENLMVSGEYDCKIIDVGT